jgi:glycosyltransferase involved in cell wall biosynthesis
MTTDNKFTVILDTYYRVEMLKEAVSAIRRQTHENLEIILINNAAMPENVEYLHHVSSIDDRVKLIHFEENQFSWDDPLKLVVCYNAGLQEATGDYVWHQSDDDIMADDYVEKMVKLFSDDSDCITAAGLPVDLDGDGNTSEVTFRRSNLRPRYMPGRVLAQDIARGGTSLFRAPGEIFTVRRDALVKAGGYSRSIEMSQLYGIVPFGTTGFDETAKFYWRHHQGQLNHEMTELGLIGIKDTFSMLKEWEIENRWQVFGQDAAKEIVSAIENQVCERAGYWFVQLTYAGKLRGSIKILSRIWRKPRFWMRSTAYAVLESRNFPLVRWGIRPMFIGAIGFMRIPKKLLQGSRKMGRRADR